MNLNSESSRRIVDALIRKVVTDRVNTNWTFRLAVTGRKMTITKLKNSPGWRSRYIAREHYGDGSWVGALGLASSDAAAVREAVFMALAPSPPARIR